MRHLYIDLIVFSKSSMKEGSSDIRLFGFKTKEVFKDKHQANSDPLDNMGMCLKEIYPF